MCLIGKDKLTPVLTSLWVNETFIQAVIDTGASHSCVSGEFVKKAGVLAPIRLDTTGSFAAVDAQNKEMKWNGSTLLEVAVPNDQFRTTQNFQVIPDLPYDVLIGVDFLSKFKANISFKTGMLEFTTTDHRDVRTPVFWSTGLASPFIQPEVPLQTTTKLKLGPGETCFVQCRVCPKMVRTGSRPASTLGVTTGIWGTLGVLTMKAVCVVVSTPVEASKRSPQTPRSDLMCEVAITNFTNNRVEVPVHSVVATFTRVERGDSISLVIDPATTIIDDSMTDSTNHDQANERWWASLPKPHPSRLASLPNLINPAQAGTATRLILPPFPRGVCAPDTFDLPGIAPNDRPGVIQRVRDFLEKWVCVFSQHDHDYGESTVESLFIELTTNKPIYKKPYNIPFHLRAMLQKQLQELLAAGVIEPAASPFSAPIVLVAKKDGSIRLCLDFRMLNAVTKRDGYPLPRIDTSLGLLRGAKVFSSMDLVGGYHQVVVNQTDREKLAFASPWGQFQYRRAPFGVVNMPALFSRMMDKIFAGLLWIHVLIYLDDILCFSETVEEHFTLLEQVFSRLLAAGLKLKGKKCSFFRAKVQYLGHLVSADGIELEEAKVAAIRAKTYPTSLHELRSDLGLFSYYRMFVPNFSTVAEPLTRLLGETPKDKALMDRIQPKTKEKTKKKKKARYASWVWGPEQDTAYDTLKKLLTEAPVLGHPDFSKPFIIDTDASQFAVGAVCSQLDDLGNEHPVVFASRSFSKAERRYSATKREALAVYWAVHKAFHSYTYGAPFLLRTDHAALTKIFLDGTAPEPIIAGWQLQLSAYSYEIIHRAGKDHSNADGLSRPTENGETKDTDVEFPDFLGVVSGPPGLPRRSTRLSRKDHPNPVTATTINPEEESMATEDIEVAPEIQSCVVLEEILLAENPLCPRAIEVLEEQKKDKHLQAIRTHLENEEASVATDETRLEATRCSLIEGIVYVWVLEQRSTRKQLKVPRMWLPNSLVSRVLGLAHDDMTAGHLDTMRTFHRITATYWWPGLWTNVEKWVSSCPACQTRKTARTQKLVSIHEGFRPTYPFQMVSMDVTEVQYPQGDTVYILVFIDLFSRWVEVATTTVPVTSAFVVEALMREVIARHGTPEILVSDNAKNLASVLINDVCKLLESKRIFIAPYTPQTNGVVERFNRTIKGMLTMVIQDKRDQWLLYLPDVLFAYRSAFHSSIQDTPFFVLYGRDPRQVISAGNDVMFSLTTADAREKTLERILYARKMVRKNLVAAQEKSADQFNKKCSAVVPYTGLVMYLIPEEKRDTTLPVPVRPQWCGPFRVNRQLGPVSYEIQKPGGSATIRAHHRQLKNYLPRDPESFWLHTTLASKPNPEHFTIKKVHQHRRERDTNVLWFQVSWEGFVAKDKTWETYENLMSSVPALLTDYLARHVT